VKEVRWHLQSAMRRARIFVMAANHPLENRGVGTVIADPGPLPVQTLRSRQDLSRQVLPANQA